MDIALPAPARHCWLFPPDLFWPVVSHRAGLPQLLAMPTQLWPCCPQCPAEVLSGGLAELPLHRLPLEEPAMQAACPPVPKGLQPSALARPGPSSLTQQEWRAA